MRTYLLSGIAALALAALSGPALAHGGSNSGFSIGSQSGSSVQSGSLAGTVSQGGYHSYSAATTSGGAQSGNNAGANVTSSYHNGTSVNTASDSGIASGADSQTVGHAIGGTLALGAASGNAWGHASNYGH